MITDINECASDPCNNSARCEDTVNGFSCVCTDGYTGVTCDTGKVFFIHLQA